MDPSPPIGFGESRRVMLARLAAELRPPLPGAQGAGATDVVALLEVLGDQLRMALDSRIRVHVAHDPGCPPCSAERAELVLVLLELVTNARDAMPDGGTLSLSAKAVAGAVEISVADTGVGMDAVVRQQATRPGFTTKTDPRKGGHGLDKAVQLARACGGELSIRSELHKGAVVTLRLPGA